MSLFEATVLGLVQGITEFLPISSTAHLRIAPELFGWPDPGAAYSAIIQLGTVAAVIIYFWRDLLRLAGAFFKGLADKAPFGTVDSRLAWYVVFGTIPAAVCGLVFKRAIESDLRSLYIIAGSMISLAIVLFFAEKVAKHQRTISEMTLKDGIVIGLWQCIALIPGSSRSGTTLTGGLTLGLKREDAARYSFLLSIPVTAAAGVFEIKSWLHAVDRPSTTAVFLGTGVAFVSGMAAIAGLLRFLRTRSTMVFVVYRIALGCLLITLLVNGRLKPLSGAESIPEPSRALPVGIERK